MQTKARLILLLAASIVLAGCNGDAADKGDDTRRRVFVSIQPLAYFAERIAGGHVAVDVLVAPGQDPHTYAPTPRQMVRLGKARLFLCVGMPFERTIVAKLASQRGDLKVVDVSEGIDRLAAPENHHDHAGHAHEAETDPHIWMSPKLAKTLARRTCDELCSLDSAHEADFRKNLQTLLADLDRLDAELTRTLAPLRGKTFFVFHPAFGYFARAYGLKQEAVETGGKAPTAKHVKKLIDQARADGVRVIFVQPQFSRQTAQAIARQIDGAVIPLDPLERDYIANLERIGEQVQAAMRPAASRISDLKSQISD